MAREGVSPLIAAVLLIAFVVGVAGILTTWMTTLTQEQTRQLENQSVKQIDCSFGLIDVFETTTESHANTSWASVAVTNKGTVDFNNTSVTAISGGSVLGRGYIEDFKSGETRDVNVSWGNSEAGNDVAGADEILVGTKECPTVSVRESVG